MKTILKILLLIVVLLTVLGVHAQTVKYADFFKYGVMRGNTYKYSQFESCTIGVTFYDDQISFHTKEPFTVFLGKVVEAERYNPVYKCRTTLYDATDNEQKHCQVRISMFDNAGTYQVLVFYSDMSFVYQFDEDQLDSVLN